MTLAEAALLGVIQGLTEFLPISSSGHLVLFEHLLGVKQAGVTFEVAVHAGTLLAVVWVYAADIVRMLAALARPRGAGVSGWLRTRWRDPDARTVLLVIAGSVPTAAIALAFRPAFEAAFGSLTAVAAFWLLTGAVLWYAEGRLGDRGRGPGEMTLADALFVGVMQGAAVAPGLSRSGMTLAAGLVRGIERAAAARFSFLLSLPAVTGAVLLDVKDMMRTGTGLGAAPLLVGAAVAAVSGVLAIRFLLRVLQGGHLRGFAYYVWVLGLAVLAWRAMRPG